ncbi:MAG TPA: hypothetical protein VED40_06135 [Azospirillaceae bacterium]|nr:hypothetical protein [Azospirillaceae bacterium]
MKNDIDTLLVAAQLVREMGADAVTVARIRLVELIAANNLRAAAFWRAVMQQCEVELARTSAAPAPADLQVPPQVSAQLH